MLRDLVLLYQELHASEEGTVKGMIGRFKKFWSNIQADSQLLAISDFGIITY